MSGRKLAFVSAAVCKAVVDPGDVVNRMEEVFHWLGAGAVIENYVPSAQQDRTIAFGTRAEFQFRQSDLSRREAPPRYK